MGQAVVAGVALAVLIQINPLITLIVFLPLVVVLTVVNLASKRIRALPAGQPGSRSAK